MDESLSDFKEKKTTQTGPKNTLKPGGNKQSNKRPKKPRGQKDIRTALKPKKNELVSYTKKFDEVCKRAGLDVDSEQLQLAIALSKSLENNGNENCSSNNLVNPKDKTTRIRTTLQEYGFKIPEIKISANKRQQKRRNNYKLLLTSDIEKHQIISDKYSQVLFAFGKQSSLLTCDHFDHSDKKLYYVSTNISYREIQNNDILYVENLIEQSVSSGNLLRDWSSIPGRPESPDRSESIKMDFSEIDCSQDELDVVLSGTLKSSKEVLKNKLMILSKPILIADEDDKVKIKDKSCSLKFPNRGTVDNILTPSKKITCEIRRSTSPDLFDEDSILNSSKDEIYSQLITSINEDENISDKVIKQANNELNKDNSNDYTKNLSREYATNNLTNRKSNDFMEITCCVKTNLDLKPYVDLTQESVIHVTTANTSTVHLSQTTKDKTKRVSNDFMEITECVVDNFNMPHHSIDLTQKSGDDIVTSTGRNEIDIQPVFSSNIEAEIDLTQNSNDDKNIDINECHQKNNVTLISQSSNSNDELPLVCISGKSNRSPNDSNDTIILSDAEINEVLCKQNKLTANSDCNGELCKTSADHQNDESPSKASQTFFDEFIHDHSDDILEEKCSQIHVDDTIDITQSSDSTEISYSTDANKAEEINKNIQQKGNVSIDYDELFNDVLQKSGNTSKNNISMHSLQYNVKGNNGTKFKDISGNCSEVFDCTKESNCSRNISEQGYGWENFGGISVMDVEENGKLIDKDAKKSIEINVSNDNYVSPVVDVKETIGKCDTDTPIKDITKVITVATPSNEYFIKTDGVTPMLDYTSMTTPERNRELDKYGLKPFKRKRAIQLLTHIYNQTHPTVQSCSKILEEQPIPPKKQRRIQPSPKKQFKSNTLSRSPIEDQKENIYEVTNEKPDVRAIECLEEDWVFQKREKARVQSCRVPLHIAFHNYVSCRRRLREVILRYEPINIDIIHKGLVSDGYRYDPKELLKFLDKRCMTVKTADNNSRNKRHY